jgi:hypothetical protein
MHFAKSLLIAFGATGTTMAAVAVAGLMTNTGPFSPGNPSAAPAEKAPESRRRLVLDPIPLDMRGYGLNGTVKGDVIYVSVELVVARERDRKAVCALVPRLQASVLRDLGPRFWRISTPKVVEGPDVDGFVRNRFQQALGWEAVERVSVRFVGDRRQAPGSNCRAAVHGAWQSWIRSGPFRER